MPDRDPGYQQRTVVDVGVGAAGRLLDHAERLGCRRVAVLLEPALAGGPVEHQVATALPGAPVRRASAGEPTVESVAEVAETLAGDDVDCVVAVGGGSVLDTGKVARAMVETAVRGLDLPDAWPGGRVALIAVPTTAGTGAEIGAGALVIDRDAADKVLVKRPQLAAAVAVCDARLTVGLPAHLTATTGLDALAQAILAYVAAGPRSIAGQHALAAIRLLRDHLPRAVADGSDLAEREAVMLGSVTSALGMFNAPPTFGAEHVFAEPLGAALRLAHGHAVAALLAPVAEYNAREVEGPYAELGRYFGDAADGADDERAADAFVRSLRDVVVELGVEPLRLPQPAVVEQAVAKLLGAGAFDVNPRPVARADVDAILAAATDGSFRLADTSVPTTSDSGS